MIPFQPGRRNLLCILDWGLGHASRSLALAEALEAAGETTFLASCGRARNFLEAECPDRTIYELPPYAVTYPTRSMPLNVALQLPRWLRTIWREHRVTQQLVNELEIDRLISDNRFGCYLPGCPSVFLTHQLHPITHNRVVSWIYRRYLQRFDEFWVPDFQAPEQRISGKLSSSAGYENVRFIGPLSRLTAPPAAPARVPVTLALLSGPEPMRTQLEQLLLQQFATLPGPYVLVRGLPGEAPALPDHQVADLTVHNFADAAQLSELIPAARHLICRSGYSTLMDIYALQTTARLLLIPTPGQTEQIYLARREARKNGHHFLPQEKVVTLHQYLR